MRRPPLCRFFDLVQRQPRNIDQPAGPLDILFHKVDQVRATRHKFRGRMGRDLAYRIGNVICARIFEIDHASLMACWIAARMLG